MIFNHFKSNIKIKYSIIYVCLFLTLESHSQELNLFDVVVLNLNSYNTNVFDNIMFEVDVKVKQRPFRSRSGNFNPDAEMTEYSQTQLFKYLHDSLYIISEGYDFVDSGEGGYVEPRNYEVSFHQGISTELTHTFERARITRELKLYEYNILDPRNLLTRKNNHKSLSEYIDENREYSVINQENGLIHLSITKYLNDNKSIVHNYFFSPDHNYLPIKHETIGIVDGVRYPSYESTIEEFTLDINGMVFPKVIKVKNIDGLTGIIHNDRTYTFTAFDMDVQLNESEFEIDIPNNYRIKDEILNQDYVSVDLDNDIVDSIYDDISTQALASVGVDPQNNYIPQKINKTVIHNNINSVNPNKDDSAVSTSHNNYYLIIGSVSLVVLFVLFLLLRKKSLPKNKFINIFLCLSSFMMCQFVHANENNQIENETIKLTNNKFCGIDSTVLLAKYFNIHLTRKEGFQLCYANEKGESTFKDLMIAFKKINLFSLPLQINSEFLYNLKIPAILYVNNNHFVVYYGGVEDKFVILDFPNPPMKLSVLELESVWKGKALLVSDQKERLVDIINTLDVNVYSFDKLFSNLLGKDFNEEKTLINNLKFETIRKVITDAYVNQKIIVSFPFSNNTTGKIDIIGVKTSCNCTNAYVNKNEVNEGEAGEVSMVIDLNLSTAIQEYKATVIYEQNAKKQAIELTALVKPNKFIQLDKDNISVSNVSYLNEVNEYISLKTISTNSYIIESVTNINKHINTKIINSLIAGSNDGQIKMSLPSKSVFGTIQDSIHINILTPKRVSIQVPVQIEVKEPYIIEPTIINFRDKKQQEINVKFENVLDIDLVNFDLRYNKDHLHIEKRIHEKTITLTLLPQENSPLIFADFIEIIHHQLNDSLKIPYTLNLID